MTTTNYIRKWGNSLGIRINSQMAKNLGLNDGDLVSCEIDNKNKSLIIKASKKKPCWPIKENELILDLNSNNSHYDLLANPLSNEILD